MRVCRGPREHLVVPCDCAARGIRWTWWKGLSVRNAHEARLIIECGGHCERKNVAVVVSAQAVISTGCVTTGRQSVAGGSVDCATQRATSNAQAGSTVVQWCSFQRLKLWHTEMMLQALVHEGESCCYTTTSLLINV